MRGRLASIFFTFEKPAAPNSPPGYQATQHFRTSENSPPFKKQSPTKNKKVKRQILKSTAPDDTDKRPRKRNRPLKKAPKTQW